ncbi:MAG TPA: hypothetical protein VJ508_11010, partial [Saprospiraceae bacterium]|nr:hypothetical protein [Saprospiraceae bacterium]
MKTAALVFIILDVLVLFGFGAFYLLGFAMSFDAPDSGSDPKAWWLRFVFFLPVLLMLVALIYAVVAFSAGNYKRSFLFSIVPVAAGVLIYMALMISSLTTMMKFKNQTAKEAAEAKLYPEQRFLRQVEGGTDTIIVFPNRLVAYRKYQGTDIPWGGP